METILDFPKCCRLKKPNQYQHQADGVGLESDFFFFAFYFPVLIFFSEHVFFYIIGEK